MKFEMGEENNPKGKVIIYWEIECEKIKDKICSSWRGPVKYLGYELILFHDNHVEGKELHFHNLEELTKSAQETDVDLINAGKAECIQDIINQRDCLAEKYFGFCINKGEEKESKETREISESEKLQHLTKLIGRYREASEKWPIMREIYNLKVDKEKYDINNLMKAALIKEEKGQHLCELYLQKYFFVCNEEYEKAAETKKQISELEEGKKQVKKNENQ